VESAAEGIPSEGGKLESLEEGVAFDAETFVKAERDFQQVLVDLVGDKSLERFRTEYEKLHRALKKSHESERRLIKRCRELNNEIVTNAAKVQTALRLSQEDQKTIAQLRKELDKAWAMVDLSHKKETQSKETIQKLRVEVANLTRLVEQGAGLSIGQEQSVKELLKIKEELSKERDELRAAVEQVRGDATSLAEQLQAQEREQAAAEAQIKTLRTQLAAKSVDTEKEQYKRKALEEQLKELKAALEARQAELRQKQLQIQKAAALSSNLEH
jgi:chromosome segregation ATPase